MQTEGTTSVLKEQVQGRCGWVLLQEREGWGARIRVFCKPGKNLDFIRPSEGSHPQRVLNRGVTGSAVVMGVWGIEVKE